MPTSGGLIWGAGPVFLLPTANDDRLGAKKWGLGPTAVLLKQEGPWTYGALLNHIWSVAGDSDRANLSTTFIQPFLAYVTTTQTTFTVNTESTYDWKSRQWSVPINLLASQLMKVGPQPLSIGIGARYWAASAETAQHGWGLRLVLTLLFPK